MRRTILLAFKDKGVIVIRMVIRTTGPEQGDTQRSFKGCTHSLGAGRCASQFYYGLGSTGVTTEARVVLCWHEVWVGASRNDQKCLRLFVYLFNNI